jgi:predicted porin
VILLSLLTTVCASSGAAYAGLTLYDKDNWTFAVDGRAQGFLSYGFGDAVAKPVGTMVGGYMFGAIPDGSGNFATTRVRGGWAGSVMGVNATHKYSDTLSVSGRISFWFAMETDQNKGPANTNLDIRQGFLKLDSTVWGGLLIGRNLGLHTRQSIIQDAIFQDGDTVGSPCGITGAGISCGQAGYGVLYPAFNPGIVYNTPDMGGFNLSVGAYDPVRHDDAMNPAANFGQTPLPRLEFEAAFHKGESTSIDVWANGMWQRLVKTGASDAIDATGVGAGFRAGFGGFKLGFLAAMDQGGGMYIPLGDTQIDATGKLRTVTTFWGSAMYTFGNWDITAGFGQSINKQTDDDKAKNNNGLIKSLQGASAGLHYHMGPLVWVAQFFQMEHKWFNDAKQTGNVINVGATFNW